MDYYDSLFNFGTDLNLSDFSNYSLGGGALFDPNVLNADDWTGVLSGTGNFAPGAYDTFNPYSPTFNPNQDFAGGGIFAPTGQDAPYGTSGYSFFGEPTPGQVVSNTAGGGGAGGGGGNGGAPGGGGGGASNMGGGMGSAFSSLLRGLLSNPAALASLLGGGALLGNSLAQGTQQVNMPPRTDSLTPQEQALLDRMLTPRSAVDIGAADQALLDRMTGARGTYAFAPQEQQLFDRLTAPLSDDPMAMASRDEQRRALDDHFRAALGPGFDTSTPYFQAKQELERRLASQTRDEQLAERPFMLQGLNQVASMIGQERQAPAAALSARNAIIGQERAGAAQGLASLAGINSGSRDLAYRVDATNALARNAATQGQGQLAGQLLGLGLSPYLFGPRTPTTPGNGGEPPSPWPWTSGPYGG